MPTRRPDLAFQDDPALQGDPAQRNALLDAIARGGGKYVRTNVMYGKTQGGGDLSALDALVAAARQRGLRVQATLMGDPAYAKSTSGLTNENPDPRLMAQFARTVAGHEKGRIGRYSIWNEPNWNTFLQGAQQDPRAAGVKYRRLYRAGYGAIKGADKSAQVLLGEMPGHGLKAFMEGVTGGKPLKTAGFAFHPYEMPGGYDINGLASVQKLLRGYKASGKLQTLAGHQAPLYLTEYGKQRGEQPEAERQAGMLAAMRKAAAAGAREMTFYQLAASKPRDPGASAVSDSYGNLISAGRAPKPAGWQWDTAVAPDGPVQLERLVRLLTGATTPRGRGR